MYRDYFPGQLDNVDVAQKTRADGTVEVTFKRRIGTKGANGQRIKLVYVGAGPPSRDHRFARASPATADAWSSLTR
jgi:hypothetical protein